MALHVDGAVHAYGEPIASATAAMIMLHGRGATARDILSLAQVFDTKAIAYLAPQAANNTWYPYPFTTAMDRNEPWLSSALARVDQMVQIAHEARIAFERIYLLGFSQGACLTLEYAARHAQRFGGVFGLSGGLIGPQGTPRDYLGSMEQTPVFLGCSDIDPHVAKERVVEAESVFRRLGAEVTMRLYPNMGHTVNDDEVAFVRDILQATGQAS